MLQVIVCIILTTSLSALTTGTTTRKAPQTVPKDTEVAGGTGVITIVILIAIAIIFQKAAVIDIVHMVT